MSLLACSILHMAWRCHNTLRNLLKAGKALQVASSILFTIAGAVQVIELPIKHPELFESLGVAQPKVCSCLQSAA